MEFPQVMFSKENMPDPQTTITYISKFNVLPIVEAAIGPDEWTRVVNSPLRAVVKFTQLNFQWSAKLMHHHLLSNQLVCENEHELWFLIRGQPWRFSLFEFEDITALNCHEPPPGINFEQSEEHIRFHSLLTLPVKCLSPSIEDIKKLCQDSAAEISKWSVDDRVRLFYLTILSDGLLGIDRHSGIEIDHYRLVMHLDSFERYPWGRIACKDLISKVKQATNFKIYQGSYGITGFVQVLQIWAYVYIASVGRCLGYPLLNPADRPKLLRFQGRVRRLSTADVFKSESVIVTSMCERSRRDKYLTGLNYEDKKDPKVDNLINYLISDAPLADIKWTFSEKKEEVREIKKRKGQTGRKRKVKNVREDFVEDEEEEEELYRSKQRTNKQLALTTHKSSDKTAKLIEMMLGLASKQTEMCENIFKRMDAAALRQQEASKQQQEIFMRQQEAIMSQQKLNSYQQQQLATAMKSFSTLFAQLFDGGLPAVEGDAAGNTNTKGQGYVVDVPSENVRVPKESADCLGSCLSSPEFLDATMMEGKAENSTVTAASEERDSVGKEQENGGEDGGRKSLEQDATENDVFITEVISGLRSSNMASVSDNYAEDDVSRNGDDDLEQYEAIQSEKVKEVYTCTPILASTMKSPFIPSTETKAMVQRVESVDSWTIVFGDVDKKLVTNMNSFMEDEANIYPYGGDYKAQDFFKHLVTPKVWLRNFHLDAVMNLYRLRLAQNPGAFQSQRIAILDTMFQMLFDAKYSKWVVQKDDLPGETYDYLHGNVPHYAATRKKWGEVVDTVYALLNIGKDHWAAMVISLTERVVRIYDCIPTYSKVIFEKATPFAEMIPVAMCFVKFNNDITKYRIEYITEGVPRIKRPYGDCGVYALNFLECLMMGVPISETYLCDKNMQKIRGKLAAELYAETTPYDGEVV